MQKSDAKQVQQGYLYKVGDYLPQFKRSNADLEGKIIRVWKQNDGYQYEIIHNDNHFIVHECGLKGSKQYYGKS